MFRDGASLWDAIARGDVLDESPVIVRSIARAPTSAARALVASILPSAKARQLVVRGPSSDGRLRAALSLVLASHGPTVLRRCGRGLDALGRRWAAGMGWPVGIDRLRAVHAQERTDDPWIDDALRDELSLSVIDEEHALSALDFVRGAGAHEYALHAGRRRSESVDVLRRARWLEGYREAVRFAIGTVLVTVEDCGTRSFERLAVERCEGLFLAEKIALDGLVIEASAQLDAAQIRALRERSALTVSVRTPLGCEAREGGCSKCCAGAPVATPIGARSARALVTMADTLATYADSQGIC